MLFSYAFNALAITNAVVWFFAAGAIVLGIVGGVAIAFVLGGIINWFREKLYVAVHAPIIVMGVGGTDDLKATLIRKPSYASSKYFLPVVGTMTVNDNGNKHFLLSSGTSTATFPAGKSTTLSGVQIGSGKATVTGIDTVKRVYQPMDVQIDVIAVPAGGVLEFYKAAVARALWYWTNGWMGNILINWLGLGRGGLCDEWAEWTSEWIHRNNNGEICLCELVYWLGPFSGGPGAHVCIRVTKCKGNTCTGPIYYLDPHRESSTPVMPQANYEAKYGVPPGPNYILWQEKCAGN